MSHDNAHATILVATHCCMCGRALVDADSVECGIGPKCRKNAEPDCAPDWTAVTEWLGRWYGRDAANEERRDDFERSMAKMEGGEFAEKVRLDERDLANRLTHYIAAVQHDERRAEVGELIMVLRSLGRLRLADALASRLYEIRVREEAGELLVRAPYSSAFDACVPGRWDDDRWCYRVPAASRPALASALRAVFAGVKGFGPKGEFTMAAA